MYTELSDMGGDMGLPPMAPFAVRESNLAIGRSSGSENRGGYTQPEQRYRDSSDDMGLLAVSPDDDGGVISDITNASRSSSSATAATAAATTTTTTGTAAVCAPTSSIRSIGAHGTQKAPVCSLGLGRGVIAPVSPMVSFGANMPLVVLVVLVLNALMMLLCAVALLSRGGRSA